jgi:hypothetical protein
MSDEEAARAWSAAAESLEQTEVVIPPRLVRRSSGSARSIVATVLSAVAVLVFSVLLGPHHRRR